VCVAAFVLAEAGLLHNKRATTHWAFAADLQKKYPDVKVDANPIWIQDGNIYTSAGITAGIDLALAMVEEDHGASVAGCSAQPYRVSAQTWRSGAIQRFPINASFGT
jgi:transcriptional regulator GlxA family with amidase domain